MRVVSKDWLIRGSLQAGVVLMIALSGWTALRAEALRPVNEEEFLEVLNSYKGQVVVLNFWATWCSPCREEFPDLVQLYREHKAEGMVVVSLSMDDADAREEAEAFVRAQGAQFPSYIQNFQDFQGVVEKLDPDWIGALPATFMFDRTGRKVFGRVGKMTLSDFEEQLRPLLQ